MSFYGRSLLGLGLIILIITIALALVFSVCMIICYKKTKRQIIDEYGENPGK